MDEQFFGGSGGQVLGEQASEERLKCSGIFTGDDEPRGGETVLQRITRRSQFSSGRARAGGFVPLRGRDGFDDVGDGFVFCGDFGNG
jgi:hypothetical protein